MNPRKRRRRKNGDNQALQCLHIKCWGKRFRVHYSSFNWKSKYIHSQLLKLVTYLDSVDLHQLRYQLDKSKTSSVLIKQLHIIPAKGDHDLLLLLFVLHSRKCMHLCLQFLFTVRKYFTKKQIIENDSLSVTNDSLSSDHNLLTSPIQVSNIPSADPTSRAESQPASVPALSCLFQKQLQYFPWSPIPFLASFFLEYNPFCPRLFFWLETKLLLLKIFSIFRSPLFGHFPWNSAMLSCRVQGRGVVLPLK